MAKRSIFLKIMALAVIFGPVALLWIGVSCGMLSDREWALGGLTWAAMSPMLIIIIQRSLAKNIRVSGAEPAIAPDDDTRRRIWRGIWTREAWIGVLAVLLPIGVARGVAHRAWLPTLGGAGISLSFMYVAIEGIRQRRKRLNLTRQ